MRDADVADEPITELLPRLRAESGGVSAENLAFEARRYMPDGKLSTSLISKIETGKREPTATVMEALARALGVSPDVFAEYRLALARRQLDERAVGLGRALENLERFAPDPDVEKAEAVRDFIRSYGEHAASAEAPAARSGSRAATRTRRAAS